MVGANYMGGKRNYVRSKGKDRETRLQKSYFGKQRLQLLSKGLSGRDSPLKASYGPSGGPSSRASVGAADISLAHARQKSLSDPSGSAGKGVSWIPEPEYIPGSAFKSGSSPASVMARIRKAHISSSKTNSKPEILKKLDTTEQAFFLKQLLERIRTTPDLAGLSRKTVPKVSSASQRILVPTKAHKTRMQREEPEEEWPTDDFESAGGVAERSTWHKFSDDKPKVGCSSPDPRSIAYSPYHGSKCPSLDGTLDRRFSSPTFSSMEIPYSSVDYGGEPQYFDVRHSRTAASSSSLPFQLPSSPPTSVDNPARSVALKSTPGTSRRTPSVYSNLAINGQRAGIPSQRSERARGDVSEDSHFDERGLPSVIRLPRPTDEAPEERGSVYGSLFTYPDPWSIIGEILSQGSVGESRGPKDQEGPPNGDTKMCSGDSEWVTSLMGEMGEDGQDEEDQEEPRLDAPEEERLFEDDDENYSDSGDLDEGEMAEVEDWEAMQGVEEHREGQKNNTAQDADPCVAVEQGPVESSGQNEFRGPHLDAEEEKLGHQVIRRHNLSPTFDHQPTLPWDKEDKDCRFRVSEGEDTCKHPRQPLSTPPPERPHPVHRSPDPGHCGNVIIGSSRRESTGSPSRPDTLSVWAGPELKKRNGKFVGPSLFDDDEDDEF